MNLQKLLAELTAIYDLDPHGQWSGHRAAAIVNEVSEAMAKAGHAELVRAPVPDCNVVDAKRYIAACISQQEMAPLPTNDDSPLTVSQAAERFNISASTLYAICANGTLHHSRIGKGRGTIRIMPNDLQEYLRQTQIGEVDYLS